MFDARVRIYRLKDGATGELKQWLAETEALWSDQLARAIRPRAEQLDRSAPLRVGERGEQAIDGLARSFGAQSSSRVFVVKPPSASHCSAVFSATVTPKVQICPSGSLAR